MKTESEFFKTKEDQGFRIQELSHSMITEMVKLTPTSLRVRKEKTSQIR
jgi:hypothetical protein